MDEIHNELININPNHWMKKSYALDFGMAHTELGSIFEQIAEAVQRSMIHCAKAKKTAEELEGKKLMELRANWSTRFQDKMTEATLKAVMDQDPELIKEWNRYSVLKAWVTRFENMLENFRLKLGAMRSFEATRRKTIDDEM